MQTLLPRILELLEVWAAVSGLHLQTAKCEIVPLVERRLDGFVRALVGMGGRAAASPNCVEVLGDHLGA